ncbi:MAG TPA: hypothetical protein VGH72_33770 [Pseudonocardia sp.]
MTTSLWTRMLASVFGRDRVDHMLAALGCPCCFRLRISPIHWFVRLVGYCPGGPDCGP